MASATLAHGHQKRRLHLFDSSESIFEPDEAVDGTKDVAGIQHIGTGSVGKRMPCSASTSLWKACQTPDANGELP